MVCFLETSPPDPCTYFSPKREIFPVHLIFRCSSPLYLARSNNHKVLLYAVFSILLLLLSGPDSVVGIATGYGLHGPVFESRCGRDFPQLFRPALGSIQPPVQWVPGLPRGKERPGRNADPLPPSSAVVKRQ